MGDNPYDPYGGENPFIFPQMRKDPVLIGRLLGKKVRVILTNDDDLYGELTRYNRYEVVLKLDENLEMCGHEDCEKPVTVLLMKHAIVCIIPDDDKAFDKKIPEAHLPAP